MNLELMNRVLRQVSTEKDNETFDLGRISAGATVLVFLGLSIYDVVGCHKAFDFQAYGIGVGTLFAGLGAYITLKKEQPKQVAEEGA